MSALPTPPVIATGTAKDAVSAPKRKSHRGVPRRERSKWRAAYFAAALVAIPIDGMAQQPGLVFDGVARSGSDTRPVRFHFLCSSNEGPTITGVLLVELEVLHYEQLRPIFDFDPFEGPGATAGALTVLQTDGARNKTSDRFSATGSVIETGSDESFVLEVTASRREAGPLRKLGTVLRPLLGGPVHFVWRQGSAKAGGSPLTANLDVTQAVADQLRDALGPCLIAQR
jgi:hypothetical protein